MFSWDSGGHAQPTCSLGWNLDHESTAHETTLDVM